jgi:hypothetical protein
MDSIGSLKETDLVLVAVINSSRDLEIARILGWYRIPLRKAPKVVDVDFLAFYQTSAINEDGSGKIQYVAKVRGHELTTRGELLKDERDHPRANEEYYKIQLGPLIKLGKPITTTTWKRITFFYTIGKSLLEAEVVNDLVIRSEERSILWRSMRERLDDGGTNQVDVCNDFEWTDAQLMEILGYLNFKDITQD